MKYSALATAVIVLLFAGSAGAQEDRESVLDQLSALANRLDAVEQVLEDAVIATPRSCENLGEQWQAFPDADGRFLFGTGGEFGADLGETGGASEVALSVQQMPRHHHNTPGGLSGRDMQGITGRTYPVPTSEFAQQHPFNWTEGGNEPHNNMPPFLAINFCKYQR